MWVTLDGWAPNETALFEPSKRAWRSQVDENAILKRAGSAVLEETKTELLRIDAARRNWRVASEPSGPPPTNSAKEFVQLFDELRSALSVAVGASRYEKFEAQLDAALEYKKLTKGDIEKVRSFNSARNVQQHSQGGIEIFVRDYAVLDELRHLTNKLTRDRVVSQQMIKRKDVVCAGWHDHVLPFAKLMLSKKYSHIPILGERGTLEGVFSADTLLHAAVHDELAFLEAMTKFEVFRELAAYRDGLTATESVLFFKPDTTLAVAHKRYRQQIEHGERISLGFVTDNGTESEPILGLITIWDFPTKL
jgi:CBS domain-containing protein